MKTPLITLKAWKSQRRAAMCSRCTHRGCVRFHHWSGYLHPSPTPSLAVPGSRKNSTRSTWKSRKVCPYTFFFFFIIFCYCQCSSVSLFCAHSFSANYFLHDRCVLFYIFALHPLPLYIAECWLRCLTWDKGKQTSCDGSARCGRITVSNWQRPKKIWWHRKSLTWHYESLSLVLLLCLLLFLLTLCCCTTLCKECTCYQCGNT